MSNLIPNKDGSWNISTKGSDLYDFSLNNLPTNKVVATAVVTARIGQQVQSITPFTTTVSFTQTVSTKQNNKKK